MTPTPLDTMADALPRTILKGPAAPQYTAMSQVVRLGLGSLLSAPYLVLGWLGGCPGIRFRPACWRLALAGLLTRPRLSLRRLVSLAVGPLDSVRYFEFDFVRSCLIGQRPRDYLDVSSPRLFPLTLVRERPELAATLLNPDVSDLADTQEMVAALKLGTRCRTEGRLIAESGLAEGSFDLVTSISVVEHIPEDSRALAEMWRLLRPGGRLVMTVPCSPRPYEEWADFNKYGLLDREADGLVFWQRFYSPACLTARVFSVLGQPSRMIVYGERRAGNYDRNVQAKMRNRFYPIWREPWMMAREWRVFDGIEQLPGIGIVGLEFVKG